MKEKIAIYEKRYLLFPLLLSVICILFLPIFYHEVDDRFLQDIVYSAPYNEQSEYLKMISTPLGFVLRWFTIFLPGVNWLSVLYTGIITMSFTAFVSFIQKTSMGKECFSFCFGFLSIAQMLVFMHMTFTVVSFVGVAGAIAFGITHIKTGKAFWRVIFMLIFCFFAVSVRMRREIVYVVALLSLPWIAGMIKRKKNTLICALLIMLALFGTMFCVREQNKKYIEKHDLQESVSFHAARSAIFDTAWFTYEEASEVLQNAGISENDLQMVYQFLLNDMSVFDTQRLKDMGKGQTLQNKYNFNVPELLQGMVTNPYVIGLCVFFVLFLLLSSGESAGLAITFAEAMMFILYLHVRQRAEARVVFPVALVAVLFMLFCIAEHPGKRYVFTKKHAWTIVFVVLVCMIGVKQYHALYVESKNLSERSDIFAYAKENPDIYVTATAWTRNHLYSRRMQLLTKNIDAHIIHSPYGDWYSYFPYYYARMKKLGLGAYAEKALCMLIEDESCRFLTCDKKEIDMVLIYFEEHYGVKVEAVQIKSFAQDGFVLYRFRVMSEQSPVLHSSAR